MARIVYSLSGQGRGHTSRVIAISDELRQRGHEVLLCCGGTAQEILESRGERVLHVPALRQVLLENRVRHMRTVKENWRSVVRLPEIVTRLADAFADYRPDLLITDFEAFSPWAARRIGLPVLSFNHQQVVTETRYPLPLRYRSNWATTRAIIQMIAPRWPVHVLLSSFFFPPLRQPARTTLVPPIIRAAVQALVPRRGEHVLVYYNQSEGGDQVIDTLRQVDASFILYNFTPPERAEDYPNLQFKQPCLEGFLEDLAASRAVLCTAGFTLISEALFLGKPLLVAPNRGIFEQTINALFLQREGLGEAVIDRPLSARDVTLFLARLDAYRARLRNRPACGNRDALACIERVLGELRPSVHARPAPAYEPVTEDP